MSAVCFDSNMTRRMQISSSSLILNPMRKIHWRNYAALSITFRTRTLHDSQTFTSSTTYVAFVTVNGFSRLKLLRILWPWMKGDGFGSSGSPPNGFTLLRSTTYRTTLVKLNDAPISWFWAVAISWIFPHPMWIVSYVLAGSQPYNFNTSCDPAYRHSPPWLK